MPNLIKAAILGPDFFHRMPIGVGVCPSAAGQAQAVATVGTVEDICFFNTAAHRDVIQASCYPMASKTNCTTIVFKKFCITTRTRQRRSKPFLEREGFGFFVFGGVPRRTTKASAAHGRAASAQAQCTADAYFYAAPSLLMGESGYRLRFDVIFRNTPAFPAPLCRATVEQSETERFYPTSCR